MEKLSSLLINRIIQDGSVTLSQLETRATERGVSLPDLYSALDKVGRDKRIARKVLRGEVVYCKHIPKTPTDHLAWVRANYIRPHNCQHNIEYTSCEHCAPFPEISYNHLFLKTKEERDNFKALKSGRPVYMQKNKYAKK